MLTSSLSPSSFLRHLNIGAGRIVWQDIVRIDQCEFFFPRSLSPHSSEISSPIDFKLSKLNQTPPPSPTFFLFLSFFLQPSRLESSTRPRTSSSPSLTLRRPTVDFIFSDSCVFLFQPSSFPFPSFLHLLESSTSLSPPPFFRFSFSQGLRRRSPLPHPPSQSPPQDS